MSFVNRSGDPLRQSREAGAPPGDVPTEFDPDDPDVVKVFYDVSAWTVEQRGELTAVLADRGLAHRWIDDEVVVPESIEAEVDTVFEVLEDRLGPFPVILAPDSAAVGFQIDDLDDEQRDLLETVLIEAEIAHRFDDQLLAVAESSADQVDELLDALERGDLASVAGDCDVAPEVLGQVFSMADRIGRDETDAVARRQLFELAAQLSPSAAPFGLAPRSWATIVAGVRELCETFDAEGFDPERIATVANDLKAAVRPYV